MIGTTLSQYHIDTELGRGGMGIVYRATDTKLNRTVAIKVLPAAALASEDDRARFFREAQAAASLSHPNIATVYQIDEAVPVEDGKEPQPGAEKRLFIAMEFIEGETLQDYVKKGPLKLAEAVQMATQVADALKAAHAKDIVHRDIKSANVMLTSEGVAKVLDFGLAKTSQSTMLTRMGSTLGTINYMSPEQARGEEVDARTDLYSLGTMLYEMIAGKLPFSGEYEQAVVYSILNETPAPLTALRTGVPMQLEWIVNKLLAKHADNRYQGAKELIVDLKMVDLSSSGQSQVSMVSGLQGMSGGIAAGSAYGVAPGLSSTTAAAATPAAKARFSMIHVAAGAALLVSGLLIGWLTTSSGSSDGAPVSVSNILKLPVMDDDLSFIPQISPSGRYLTYASVGLSPFRIRVAVNDLTTGELSYVPRSDSLIMGVFSESEEWLLLSGPKGIVRTNADGSLYQTLKTRKEIGSDRNGATAVWENTDHILFTPNLGGKIYRMRIDGTEEELVWQDSSLTEILIFQYLPRGSKVLFTGARGLNNDLVGLADLGDGSIQILPGEGLPRFVRDRFLISHSADSTLMVTDLDRNYKPVGPSQLVISNQMSETVAVSPDGSLFRLNVDFGNGRRRTEQFWFPIMGGSPESIGPAGPAIYEPTMSGDGESIAYIKDNGGDSDTGDLFRLDLDTGVETQLTFSLTAGFPDWHAEWIYFQATVGSGPLSIYRVRASGGRPEPLIELPGGAREPKVLPDGSGLVFAKIDSSDAGNDIWYYDLVSDEQRALISDPGHQNSPTVSPNGRYLAYESNEKETGFSTWVAELDGDGRWKVSDTGQANPEWSPDGQTLFFDSDDKIFRRSVKTDGAFRVLSEPVLMHQFGFEQDYSVSRDGKRLFVAAAVVGEITTEKEFTVITHWVDHIIEMLDEREED